MSALEWLSAIINRQRDGNPKVEPISFHVHPAFLDDVQRQVDTTRPASSPTGPKTKRARHELLGCELIPLLAGGRGTSLVTMEARDVLLDEIFHMEFIYPYETGRIVEFQNGEQGGTTSSR